MQSIPDNCYDELAIKALQKSRNERTPLDVFYMSKYFRQFKFFNGYNDEIIKNCCSKMRYEILNIGQLIYKRFDQTEDPQYKLYIIVQGELGVYLSIGLLPENIKDVEFNEVCSIKTYQHFGQQLFFMNKEDIHEHFGLIIKPKKLTYAATLSYQYFNAYLLLSEQRKMNQEISQLYEYCLFKDIQYQELKDIVFRQGDGAHCVYLILSGQFQLSKKKENKEIQIIGILSEGELIGEYEILNNVEQRPFTMTCVSEKGEIMICDSQFFLEFVYDLVKENLEQTIDAKFNFHQLDKTSIKQELSKLNQFVKHRQSIDEVCKQNKFHYQMRPIKRKTNQSISEYKGKQSYYDLFVNIFNIASQKTQLTNDLRHRRITQYVKYTLKPMQEKLKSCQNLSANKTDESIQKPNNPAPLHNEILIQALRRKPDSKLRKTFHKSLASLSPSKKISRAEIQPNFDLGENLIIKKQYKSSDKLINNNQ